MKPNAEEFYTQDPQYIEDLILSTGLSQAELAKVLGVTDRALRTWISGDKQYPYTAQFALEVYVLSPD